MRFFDVFFSLLGLVVFSPILFILYIIGLFDTGRPIFKQLRMGQNKKPFLLRKFRSMHLNTIHAGTHEIDPAAITKWGKVLRKSKLDELPQLWNVLVGDMSLVGPRPNLLNQHKLIKEREKRGVYSVKPGITGLAQLKRIDMSTPKLIAEEDQKMIINFTLKKYIFFLIKTISKIN